MDKLEISTMIIDWLQQYKLLGYGLVVLLTYLAWKFYFLKRAVENEHSALLEGIKKRDDELNFYRQEYGPLKSQPVSDVEQEKPRNFSKGQFCFVITFLAVLVCVGFWFYFQHKYTVPVDSDDTILKAENASLKTQIASLDNTISQLQEENQNTALEAENNALSEKITALQIQLQQARAENTSLAEEVTRLNKELEASIQLDNKLDRVLPPEKSQKK